MSDAPICHYCDKPATKLCDFTIGLYIAGYERLKGQRNAWRAYTDASQPRYTCDRDLCDEHAGNIGVTHLCGPDGCAVETIDRCPEHLSADDHDADPLTEEEARRIQRTLSIRLTAPRGQLAVARLAGQGE